MQTENNRQSAIMAYNPVLSDRPEGVKEENFKHVVTIHLHEKNSF